MRVATSMEFMFVIEHQSTITLRMQILMAKVNGIIVLHMVVRHDHTIQYVAIYHITCESFLSLYLHQYLKTHQTKVNMTTHDQHNLTINILFYCNNYLFK